MGHVEMIRYMLNRNRVFDLDELIAKLAVKQTGQQVRYQLRRDRLIIALFEHFQAGIYDRDAGRRRCVIGLADMTRPQIERAWRERRPLRAPKWEG